MNDLIRRQSKRYILTKKIADSVPFISRFLAEIEWAPLKSLFWNTNDLLWLISSSLGHYYKSRTLLQLYCKVNDLYASSVWLWYKPCY